MCNCGHDEQAEAKRLKQRALGAVLIAMCLGLVLLNVAKGHPPVLYAGVMVQMILLAQAFRMTRQRRRLICGEAR